MTTFSPASPNPSPHRAAIGAFIAAASPFVSPAFGAHVDGSNGKILFTATQSDVPVNGEFKNFTADVDFNPATPDVGKVFISVDVASVSTGSAEADDLLREPDFFDARHFPHATFKSRVTTLSNMDQFQARGDFTLKGHSIELVVPFTARQEAGGLRIDGRLPISRRAFKVGEGQWADTGTLADEVQIRFTLFVPR